MPFEFTGAPPALLDSSGGKTIGFKSFSQTASFGFGGGSTTPTPTPAPNGSPFGLLTDVKFGPPSSSSPFASIPTTSSNSFGLQTSLSPFASVNRGSVTPTPSPTPPSSFGQTTPFGYAVPSDSNSSFARNASLRASLGLPSTFGTSALSRASTPSSDDAPAQERHEAHPAQFSVYNKSADAKNSQTWANQAAVPTLRSTPLPDGYAYEEEQNDVLTRALRRAEKSRWAVFGRAEMAADNVLDEVFTYNASNIPQLLNELPVVESVAPEVATFIRSIFEHSIMTQDPKASLEPVKRIDLWEDDEQLEGELGQKHKPEKLSIARNHADLTMIDHKLQAGFLRLEQIPGPEAARVLAEYVLTQYLDGATIASLKVEIFDTLSIDVGLQENAYSVGEIGELLDDLLERVWMADYRFRQSDKTHAAQKGKAARTKTNKKKPVAKQNSQASDATPNQVTTVVHDGNAAPKGFRFLDLPAELRNWVYAEQLAPFGYVTVLSRDWHSTGTASSPPQPCEVSSGADVTMLSTNRQIHREGKSILYRENTFVLVGVISTNIHPFIDRRLLPDAALPLLASVTLICDHRPNEFQGEHWYERVNWMQLQAMTSLKRLRICMVEREEQKDENIYKKYMLEHILQRVPADCEVSFGAKEFYETETIEEVIEQSDRRKTDRYVHWGDAYSVDGELLESMAKDVKKVQGRKSGHTRDYRYPEKPVTKSLQELIAAGEVDPKVVLGGSQ